MIEKLERIRDLLNEVIAEMGGGRGVPLTPARPPDDFEVLKAMLNSEEWPEAVFKAHIADDKSEADKQERAMGISEIMLPPYGGKRFLDFGCGEGHIARYVAKEAAASVGYDISKGSSPFPWETKDENALLTTDFPKVQSEGPYDLILMYDVFDHCEADPVEILRLAKSVLSDDGKIIMRCHPWCGRHGGHLYRHINKAFVHLVFSDEELARLGVPIEYNRKVLKPLNAYTKAIDGAGLKKSGQPEIDSQEVEDFFHETPIVRDRILKNWKVSAWGQDPPQFQMSQNFVDFVLKKD